MLEILVTKEKYSMYLNSLVKYSRWLKNNNRIVANKTV